MAGGKSMGSRLQFWVALCVTGIKIMTTGKAECWVVIQKDIEVTQDLGLDVKTLAHARVFVRCGGGVPWDRSCLAERNGGAAEQCEPRKRTCFTRQGRNTTFKVVMKKTSQ